MEAAVTEEAYMRLALELAAEAAAEGEVTVGAVIVREGAVVGAGRNRRDTARNARPHADTHTHTDATRRLGG